MNAAEYYKANVGLVHNVSRRGWARLQAARVPLDYEDVFQEMSIVFLKAYEGFDASRGYRFSTYYFMAAHNWLNRWGGKLIKERVSDGLVALEDFSNPDEDESLESVLYVDSSQSPELQYRVTEFLEAVERVLSPLALLILSWMTDPPDELMQEIRKAELCAEYGRSRGLNSRCMVQVTPRHVGKFVQMISNATHVEIKHAIQEIDALRQSQLKNYFGA